MKGKSLSSVRLFATPWTAAYQAPPSMRFSRQEYWSGFYLYIYIYIKHHIHTQWKIIQPNKRKEILPFATTWMDLKDIIIVKDVRQNNYHMIPLYTEHKNNNKNPAHRYRQQIGACQGLGSGKVGGTCEGGQKVQTASHRKVMRII